MFVRITKEADIIRLPVYFARLVNVAPSGDLTFELRYLIKQSDIVKHSAQTVRLSAMTRLPDRVDVTQGVQSSKQLVKNILNFVPNARSLVRNFENFIIARKNVDNTIGLDNQMLAELRASDNPRNVSALYKPIFVLRSIRELNKTNDVRPTLQVNRSEEIDESLSLRQLAHSSILMNGLDPSSVSQLVDNDVLTPNEAVNGVFLKSTELGSHEYMLRYLKKVTSVPKKVGEQTLDISEDTKVLVQETQFVDEIEMTAEIVLENSKLKDKNGNIQSLFFRFELLNSAGVVIQTLVEKVDALRHLEGFYAPSVPPLVKFANGGFTNRVTLLVKQMDPKAVAVKVYRKNFRYVSSEVESYEYVTEQPLAYADGFQPITVKAAPSHTIIYRIVPVGPSNAFSHEFTNVVVNPTKVQRVRKYVAMTSRTVNNGVSIDVTDVPLDVASFMILRRDTTIHGEFEVTSDSVIQVTSNEAATYSVRDTNLKPNHVYEYICRLFYRDGSTFDAGRIFLNYEPLVENLVDTQIHDVSIVRATNNLDVSFQITSVVNESNLDVIQKLLERQGIKEFFTRDIFTERDKLQKLIAHQVYRINLTEGIKENFGVITDSKFTDSKLRLINAVTPLKEGNQYRYEVSTLLRSPETMLNEFVKTVTDPISKKTYSYKPSKFLHPVTLKHGNIVNSQALVEHYPQEQLSFGSVGNVSRTDVSFVSDSAYVANASAEMFDKFTNVIKWSINGNPEQVDHFIVMKEFLGQRHIVGKAHALNNKTTFRFVHKLTKADLGNLTYVIVPVFNNYNFGAEVQTEAVPVI